MVRPLAWVRSRATGFPEPAPVAKLGESHEPHVRLALNRTLPCDERTSLERPEPDGCIRVQSPTRGRDRPTATLAGECSHRSAVRRIGVIRRPTSRRPTPALPSSGASRSRRRLPCCGRISPSSGRKRRSRAFRDQEGPGAADRLGQGASESARGWVHCCRRRDSHRRAKRACGRVGAIAYAVSSGTHPFGS